MKNRLNMGIDGNKYEIALTNHLFETRTRNNGTHSKKSLEGNRIKALSIYDIRALIRTAVTPEILESTDDKFVITYPRTDEYFSGILIARDGHFFVVISIYHSTTKYKNRGLFPNIKKGLELNKEEYLKALVTGNPNNCKPNTKLNRDPNIKPMGALNHKRIRIISKASK